MVFEIHITVDCSDKERFKIDCQTIGVKPILIDTLVDEQLMTSSKHESVNYDSTVNEIVNKLNGLNYKIRRIKVEIFPDDSIPYLYYESHLRLKLPITFRYFDNIKVIADKYNAHTSRNAFKVDPINKIIYWMLTLRDKESTISVFKQKVDILHKELSKICEVDKIEIEQCVLDTNESIDNKWFLIDK